MLVGERTKQTSECKNAKAIWGIDVDNAYDEYEFAVSESWIVIQGRRIQQLSSLSSKRIWIRSFDVEWEFSLIEEKMDRDGHDRTGLPTVRFEAELSDADNAKVEARIAEIYKLLEGIA